jgi:hypothetical protein
VLVYTIHCTPTILTPYSHYTHTILIRCTHPLYPLPLQYVKGAADRPTADQLLLLEAILRTVPTLLEEAPDVMKLNSASIDMDNTAAPPAGTELTITLGGEQQAVHVSNCAVITVAELERAKLQLQQKREEAAASARGGASEEGSGEDGEEDHEGGGGGEGEDGKCMVQ